MINNVVMLGRLVEDPELRKTPSEISVARFTIAVDRSYQKAGQDRQSDFFDIVAWRSTAEFICKYFKKGSMIAITGSLQTRSYEDKNGQKRRAFEIVVDQASFCEGRRSDAGAPVPAGGNTGNGYQYQTAPQSFASGNEADFEEIGSDDDLPF